MHIQQIDRYCDRYEQWLKDGAEVSPAEFLAEQGLAPGDELLHELQDVEREYRHPPGSQTESPTPQSADSDARRAGPADENIGAVIDCYKLLGKLGEGGMGVVYLAEQTDPVERRVALKIIKPGLDSKEVIARFEAERQALAMMDHPNIARVLDAGTTKTGRPYFVMELVQGLPVTKYCDEHRLTPRERLELFIPVCQAVQHAHQKGVIHRDLKPSNILVARSDERAVPKIIDFGVAKALSQPLTEKTLLTQYGQILGTIDYMSPEQAQFNELDVDTRSDIYSLGVVLYELLTGETPFDKQRLRTSGFEELLRIICEEEPPRPSTRLSGSDTLPLIAASRRTERAKLSTLVRGDLDWIVMKCLEKDCNRRYETANGLARDIQRFLGDEPIEARPPSAMYRFQKFARRNRGRFAVGGVLVVALMLGVVGLGISYSLINDALNRTAAAEHRTKERLYESLVGQVVAGRRSGEPGQRFESLDRLREALALRSELGITGDELRLRNEAIAVLTLPDVRLTKDLWTESAGQYGPAVVVDRDFERYARVEAEDGTISIRRLSDDQEQVRLPDLGGATKIWGFSPNGRHLAVTYQNGNQIESGLWSLDSRELVSRWPGRRLFGNVDFSPDGRLLAVGLDNGAVHTYDLVRGEDRQVVSMPAPAYVRFHPSEPRLAIGGGSYVSIRESSTGEQIGSLGPHPHATGRVAWHPDGSLLAVACQNQIHLWDVSSGKRLHILEGHSGGGIDPQFSHRGLLLKSCAWDAQTLLWDPNGGRLLMRFTRGGNSFSLYDFSQDDRFLLSSAESEAGIWEVSDGREYRLLRPRRNSQGDGNTLLVNANSTVDIHPSNRLVAASALDGLHLWSVTTGREICRLPVSGTYSAALFHPHDGSLYGSGDEGLYRWPIVIDGNRIQIGPATRLLPEDKHFQRISISADGRVLAGIHGDDVHVLDLETDSEITQLRSHVNLREVSVSCDGRWVATGTWKGQGVKIWNARTGEHLRTLVPDNLNAHALFSPDGRWLLVTTRGQKSKFWELDDDVNRWAPHHDGLGKRRVVGFTSDGSIAAESKTVGEISLLDPRTGHELASIQSTSGWRSFSRDGSKLVVTYAPEGVQVWDLGLIRRQLAELGLDWDAPLPTVDTREISNEEIYFVNEAGEVIEHVGADVATYLTPATEHFAGVELVPGAIVVEGEVLPVESASGVFYAQPMTEFGATWSNNTQLFWGAPEPEAHLKTTLSVAAAGSYRLAAWFTKAPDFGQFRLKLNNREIGSYDGYDPRVISGARVILAEDVDLRAGINTLEFIVTGKNSDSRGYYVGIDRLELEPLEPAASAALESSDE